jgi:hypothetical protein
MGGFSGWMNLVGVLVGALVGALVGVLVDGFSGWISGCISGLTVSIGKTHCIKGSKIHGPHFGVHSMKCAKSYITICHV